MYGTVMTGRLAGSMDDVKQVLKEWEASRPAAGFVDSQLLLADDGVTVCQAVRFTDKAAYVTLADDPEQSRWWEERMRPLLADEPTWMDGTWVDA
jgi:hypothetical protein